MFRVTNGCDRLRVAVGAAVVGVVVGGVVVGCSSSREAAPVSPSVVITGAEGTATMSNPAPYLKALWDPCSLPESVTGQFDFNAKPDRVDNIPSQRSCGFMKVAFSATTVGYNVEVTVTEYPFSDTKKNRVFTNVAPTTVGEGHPAAIADLRTDPGGRAIFWGTSYGTVVVKAYASPWDDRYDAQAMVERFVSLAYPYVWK